MKKFLTMPQEKQIADMVNVDLEAVWNEAGWEGPPDSIKPVHVRFVLAAVDKLVGPLALTKVLAE